MGKRRKGQRGTRCAHRHIDHFTYLVSRLCWFGSALASIWVSGLRKRNNFPKSFSCCLSTSIYPGLCCVVEASSARPAGTKGWTPMRALSWVKSWTALLLVWALQSSLVATLQSAETKIETLKWIFQLFQHFSNHVLVCLWFFVCLRIDCVGQVLHHLLVTS